MALESADGFTLSSYERSLRELLAHEGRQLYHLATQLEAAVGQSSAAGVVDEALREFASWRLRHVGEPAEEGLWALHKWPDAYIDGLTRFGWGSVRTEPGFTLIETTDAPDLNVLAERGRPDLYVSGWRGVVDALADSGVVSGRRGSVAWDATEHVLSVRIPEGCPGPEEFSSEATSLRTLQAQLTATVKNRAAQFHFFASTAVRTFDATGEYAVRRGIQEFGKERGRALRQEHESAGLPLNLETMMSNFDYGGEGVWQFAPGSLSPEAWSQDCTYCPFAEVWRSLPGGLDLGYIYDMEFHVAEFREYNSNIRVIWDRLQTRGDDDCAFRFKLGPTGPIG